MRTLIFVMIFFLIGAFFIISENNLALNNSENVSKLGKLYFSWLEQLFQNTGNLAGYIIKFEWLPENNTVS